MADWASLLPELVQSIANCVLFTITGGVCAYMDMRAVCPSWRSSILKPSPLTVVADLRFRPRHWIMVDQKPEDPDNDDGARLFFHVLSGRFRRMRLPMLRDKIIFGASDGLLVLSDDEDPYLASVLNPLTGDMLHFGATLHDDFGDTVFTSMSGISHSTLVLWWGGWGRESTIEFSYPASNVFMEKDIDTDLVSMVAFQGNVYYSDMDGRVFKIVGPPEPFYYEIVAQVLPNMDVCLEGQGGARTGPCLLESDGELMLVCLGRKGVKVFKVDVKRRLLEEVKSLGYNRALFVGDGRCLCVDADKLIPPVDSDCIYMSYMLGTLRACMYNLSYDKTEIISKDYRRTRAACVYNLRGDTMEIISWDYHRDRPFSLVHVLLKYCDFRYM